ncbi:MAG: RsmB/NOP family class I SAM-dependent RNA methyltransferase [Synechococcales bacterium]|nr:RsmB/NOP family class I SAM-dependent RNA methyltransferase [Synechococcales bacterium]
MSSPSRLLLKLARRLFADPEAQQAFVTAIVQPSPLDACILWCRDRPPDPPFPVLPPEPWQPRFVDRLAGTDRPGQHPLHDAGYYYCLDFSSVFAASVLQAIPSPVERVFDLCASPGGKSLFAWRSLHPSLLLSNEVIGKRLGALLSNLKRCGVEGAIAASLDTQTLAAAIPQTADVVIVDAPCTGQSLLVKGIDAPGCFHPVNINKNANRQKRIIANAAQLVAPQGYLAYMTCAYSPEENEQVMDWLLSRFPQFSPVAVPALAAFQSHLTEQPCYRMFPQSGLGAGAFTVLLQNTEEIRAGDSAALEAFLQQPFLKFVN